VTALPDWIKGLASAVVPLATFLLGRWWGWYDARRQYQRRISLDRINVSLNTIDNDTLRIRTVLERPLNEVIPNQYLRDRIVSLARHATADDALLTLSPEDEKFAINFVINAVAELFSRGSIRRDMDRDVASAWYIIALACEPVSELRQQKIRALLVREDILEKFPYHESMPTLEKQWHDDRVRTMRQMAGAFAQSPQAFARMEVSV